MRPRVKEMYQGDVNIDIEYLLRIKPKVVAKALRDLSVKPKI
jgi:hypothetical protein